jgi:hypothetical protein
VPQAAHLNTITAPDFHIVQYGSQATIAKGYPWDLEAGTVQNIPWAGDDLIQIYWSWRGGVARRSYYRGTWNDWRDMNGEVL